MLLVDDLLLSPIKGVSGCSGRSTTRPSRSWPAKSEAITAALSELYMKLETGQITEAEFDAQEKVLLDRLDHLQAEEADRTGT